MGRGLGDIVNLLMWALPPWAVALLCAAVFLLALPGLRYGHRTRRIRSAIRQMVRADPEHRAAMVTRTMRAAGQDAHLLALVARESRKRGLPDLYQHALTVLAEHPTHARLAVAVRAEIERPKTHKRHPAESVIAIENLLAQGLTTRAQEQLDDALLDHPQDKDLLDLVERVRAGPTSL